MRRTLLAVGFAVLVSMLLLAPHGGKHGIEGWGLFFSDYGLYVHTDWGDFRTARCGYGPIGRVMIDMLAVQTVFLAVLLAVMVNIRWQRRRKEVKKTSTDKPVSPPPTAPQKNIDPDLTTARGRALDEIGRQPTNPSPSPPPPPRQPDKPTQRYTWISVILLLLCFGGWFAVIGSAKTPEGANASTKFFFDILILSGVLGFIFGRKGHKLFVFSIISTLGALLIFAIPVIGRFRAQGENRRFTSATKEFAEDARHYIEAGGSPPTFKATGDANNDLFARVMNDFSQEIYPIMARMNAELNALGEKDVYETSVLTNTINLETEARKRVEGQRIVEKYRHDLPSAFEAFQQKLSSYNIPDVQKKSAVAGFEDARAHFSRKSETMFNLLGKKEKIELDFLKFMDRVFSEYELNGGKISFHNATARQQYHEFSKSIDDTAKQIAAFRKEQLAGVNANVQNLSH